MGYGTSRPSYIIIGEAPGANEALVGKPFVGGAGRVADALLGQAGIPRTRCYITNIVKCRPPGNKLGPWLPKAADHCRQYLDKELAQYAGVPLILLGDVALRFILNEESITKHRGGVYHWDNRLVLPTIHPAALMREPKMWTVVVADLAYAKDMATKHVELPRNFVIAPTVRDVMTYFDEKVRPRKEPYYIDVETYGNALACLGIADSTTSAICIPWWENERWYWEDYNESLVVTGLIAAFLEDANILKGLQNGMFDLNVLTGYGFTVNGWVVDTMIKHHTVYSEMRHGLGFLHSLYVREPYYKDMAYGDKDESEEE